MRTGKKGANVGGRRFPHAFRKNIFGQDALWERKYRGIGSTARGRGDGRFPVQKLTIEIAEIAEHELDLIEAEAVRKFRTILDQQINFALNHEKK